MSTQRREIPVDAPAFDPGRNDYPLSGAKVGPAWRAAWAFLRPESGFTVGSDVVAFVTEQYRDVSPETVRNLLHAAVRAGVLESELRPVRGSRGVRNVSYFRIKR